MYRNQSKHLIQKCLANVISPRSDNVKCFRLLYSQAALGVDNYVKNRERVHSQFVNMLDHFKNKMTEYIGPNSKNMIFTEDLKNMVHLVEPGSDDVPLVVEMMLKFNSQNKDLRFGNFIFGPVVMRMFHYLDDPDTALQCFLDSKLEGFFDQVSSFQILMDLLLEHERYDDLIQVFEIIKNKQIQGTKYPRNIIVLVCAACYKRNTPESFKYARQLWGELISFGHQPMRRAATFFAALALNQNVPNDAIEILSSVKEQNYMTVRNIKAMALAELGRIDDCFAILTSVLTNDNAIDKKSTFTRDVIEKISNAVKSTNDKELIAKFTKIEKLFSENGHYTEDTLKNLLCSEIAGMQHNNNSFANQRQNNFQGNFGKYNANRVSRSRRPGITEMY